MGEKPSPLGEDFSMNFFSPKGSRGLGFKGSRDYDMFPVVP
jgi:hypothetical protein